MVIQRILSDEGTRCPLELLEKAIVTVWEEDALTARRSEFRGYTPPPSEAEYVRLNRLILAEAGINLNQAKLARLIDERWSKYASVVGREAFEDVVPCLEKLHQMNLRMGVVSNIDSTEELQKGLLDLKIEDFFSVLVASGDVGVVKPHPEIFRIASHELRLPPADLIHVGDLYAVDVMGANGAGLTGVLLDRDDRLPGVECTRIRSLEELPSLVAEL